MKEIYRLENNKFVMVNNPTHPSKPLFAITWNGGAAWSIWQTLKECERMFPILEHSKSSGYSVVQREKEDSELL